MAAQLVPRLFRLPIAAENFLRGKIGLSTSRAHTAFQRANAIAEPLLSVFVSRKIEKVDSKKMMVSNTLLACQYLGTKGTASAARLDLLPVDNVTKNSRHQKSLRLFCMYSNLEHYYSLLDLRFKSAAFFLRASF